jgi:hypothetical protein
MKTGTVESRLDGCRMSASCRRLARVISGAALAIMLLHAAVAAQSRLFVSGTVQWVTSTRLQVMTDANVSVSVDVSRVAQDANPRLRAGNRVAVVGVVAPDGSHLIAHSIEPGEPGGGYWNLFPQLR